jgi:hypothetical protein
MLDTALLAHYELASPSLLAQTPALTKKLGFDLAIQTQAWEDLRLQLEQRLYGLRNWRLSWWMHWARLAEAILPRRYHWLIVPNTMTRGLAINDLIKDPTGAQAVNICTAGMRSGLMSSSRPWFKIKAGLRSYKIDRPAQLWFEEVEDRIYSIMATSNFYNSATQMFQDEIVFGTAPVLIYEDRQDVIRCFNPCAGEYFLGSGSDFRTNAFYRTFVLTVAQTVMMFGLDKVGSEVQGLWEQKGASLETEVIIAHAIEPNFSLQMPGMPPQLGVVPGNFEWREYYWLWGKTTPGPLSRRGFRQKPFIVTKWSETSNDPYGRSAGMDALPDILQLQVMTVRQAEAIEKMVRPPMVAGAQMRNQPSSSLPGRVTYVTDFEKAGFKPAYEVKPDIADMAALIEKIEKRVERWFYVPQFQMLEQLEGVQPRNEMEIAERRGEKLQVLGPVVEQNTGQMAEMIRRIFAIMARRGLIPPKPQSLLGVPLDIEFDTMITVAQRAAQTAVMERYITVVSKLQETAIQTQSAERPLDNVNLDTFSREYGNRIAFPDKIMRGEDEVKQLRQQRAQAQQQAQQKAEAMQAATHAAPALASAAKDASEIDTGGALNALQIASGMGGAAPGATGLPQ